MTSDGRPASVGQKNRFAGGLSVSGGEERSVPQLTGTPGWAVAEIKFERLLPEWVAQLVRMHSWRPESVSKYCAGIGWYLRAGLLPAGLPSPVLAAQPAALRRGSELVPSPA